MRSQFFEHSNYIYECKSSPSQMGEYFNNRYLRNSIKKLRKRFDEEGFPSGYRYIFPVNNLDSDAIGYLESLQNDYPNIDIKYYVQDQVDNLIKNLNKVNTLPSLVAYIESLR